MIICHIPEYCISEVKYTLNIIFRRLFSEAIEFIVTEKDVIEVKCDSSERSLILPATFFKSVHNNWLGKLNFPDVVGFMDRSQFDSKIADIPVVFGDPNIEDEENVIRCHIDIVGMVFFCISRYEEGIEGVSLDNHGRFPSTSSLAHKLGFLERPIVDEYVEFTYFLMVRIGCNLERKHEEFRKLVTCDVDWPFDPIRSSLKYVVASALNEFRAGRFLQGLSSMAKYGVAKVGLRHSDSASDMIDWIMQENERVGNTVAFYFITKSTHGFDPIFNFKSRKIRNLLKRIASRGHEIGLHPGYRCCNNPDLFRESANLLKTVLLEEGIEQPQLGGRMHYLRWDARVTPALWDENDFSYDSTLAYADFSGFRCGTCHAYPMYDLLRRQPLSVYQRPLINMDCTVISSSYEDLGPTKLAENRFKFFKSIVRSYNGEYVLLWHNTYFPEGEGKKIYKTIIR